MLSSPGVSEGAITVISTSFDYLFLSELKVPVEAGAFLGAVAGFVVLLFVFFLYLNKKLCFYTVGGALPCCDDTLTKTKDKIKDLSKAYNYGDRDSSSDSEAEVSRRLSNSKSFTSNHSNLKENHQHHTHNHNHRNHLTNHNHRGGVLSNHNNVNHVNHHQNYHSCNNNGSIANYGSNHNSYHQLGPSRSNSQYSETDDNNGECGCDTHSDLISLAEKGRMGGIPDENGLSTGISGGVGASSSSASSSGSTTSGDDDLLTHRTLRHRDPRAYRQMSPSGSPYQGHYHQKIKKLIKRAMSFNEDEESNPSISQESMQEENEGLAEASLLIHCGCIEAGFAYDHPTRTLTVHILQAKEVPNKEKGGASQTQVRMLLVPNRKQKCKTRIRPGENPQFNEAFVFSKVNSEDIPSLGVRLRLYGCEKLRREKMIGEVIVPFANINLTLGNTFWLTLEPRASLTRCESRTEVSSLTRSDSTGSNHSIHTGVPEMLLGLTYNGTTGRLAVEIVKGSHFRNMANTRAPDTYVKLVLLSSSGQEIAHSKTSVRRGQPNPLFKETFIFQVALFQLPDVSLMVSVYTKRSMKRKDVIGWFALGLNSSGDEELEHWNSMRDLKGEQVCRWHVLLES